MAKMSLDELKTKWSEKIVDEDLSIELLEDLTDSISDTESEELSNLRADVERLENELEDAKRKYKERFLTAVDEKIEEEKIDEPEEEEVIDIREI